MAVRKPKLPTNEIKEDNDEKYLIPFLPCKTATNTRIEYTRHGIIRHLITVEIKY